MKTHWLRSFIVTTILCLLVSSISAAAQPTSPSSAAASEPAAAPNWWIERAEAPLTFKNMNPHSLGLTSTGSPIAVYGGDHLYRSYIGRTGWTSETVDPAWGVGSFASLAIGSDDKLHIVYIDTAAGILRYATNRYGSWQIETQFSGAVLSASNAVIAVDASGDPHIVFYSLGALQYISFDSEYGTWSDPETLATGTGSLDYPGAFALAVGTPIATPYVSYHKHVSSTNGSLFYTKRTGPDTWSTPLALAVGGDSSGDYNDIVVIGSTPYVAGSGVSNISGNYLNRVQYTFLEGANWHPAEMVTFTGNNAAVAPPAAIVLRLVGTTPYLAYQDPGVGYYWQTRTADDIWSSEEAIVTGAGAGSWASFAWYGGNPSATYYNTSTHSLYFRNKTAAGWQTPVSLATNGHDVASQPSLAVDALGRSHISYRDNTSEQLVYARYDGVGWTHLTVDTGPVMGVSSLALENNLPRVLYLGEDGSVRYTFYLCAPGCAFPVAEIVDSGVTSALDEPSLAVHPVTGVHAAYARNGSLVYARRIAADSWSTTVVDSGVYGKVSLALDAGGAPHLMYRKGGNLYYTYKDTAWHPADLIATGTLGESPAFKISPQGVKAAVYTEFGGDPAAHLVYSSRTCIINNCYWVPQTVAADADEFADLAFDSAGVPSIAYFKLSSWDLKLARRVAPGTWVTKIIDSRGLVGFYSAISVSPRNGKMRIAYPDTTNADLKLALEGEQVFIPLVR